MTDINWNGNDNEALYYFFLHVDMLHDFLDTRRSTVSAIRLVKNITIRDDVTMQRYVGKNLYDKDDYNGEFSNIEDAFAERLIAKRHDLLGLPKTNIPIAACEYKPGKQVEECINSRYIKIPKKANTNQLFLKILQNFRSRSRSYVRDSPLTYTCDASPWVANRVPTTRDYLHVKTVSTLLDSAAGVSNTAPLVPGSTTYQMKNILSRNYFTITRTPNLTEPLTINVAMQSGGRIHRYDSDAGQGPTLGELANIVENPPNRIVNGLGWLQESYNKLSAADLRRNFLFDIKTSQDADQTIEAKQRGIQCFFTVDKLCSMGAVIQQIPVVVFCSSDHAMMYINTDILGISSIDNEIYKIKNILSQNQSLNDKIVKYQRFIAPAAAGAQATTPLFEFLFRELKKIFEAILTFINDLNISHNNPDVTNFVNGTLDANDRVKNYLVERAQREIEPLVKLQKVISTIDLLIDDPDTYLTDLKRYETSINGLVGDGRINARTLRRNRELVANDDSFLVKVNRLTNILSFSELLIYLNNEIVPSVNKTYSLSLTDGSIAIIGNDTQEGGQPTNGVPAGAVEDVDMVDEAELRRRVLAATSGASESKSDPVTAAADEEMGDDVPAAAAAAAAKPGKRREREPELAEVDYLKQVYKNYINNLVKVITDSNLSYTLAVGEEVNTELSMDTNKSINVSISDDDEIRWSEVGAPAAAAAPAAAPGEARVREDEHPRRERRNRNDDDDDERDRRTHARSEVGVRPPGDERVMPGAKALKRPRMAPAAALAAPRAAPGGEPLENPRMAAVQGGNRYTRKRSIHVKIRRNGGRTSKRRTKTLKHRRRR